MFALAVVIYISILVINFILQRLLPNDQYTYNSLEKSPYNPPNYIFPIAWFLLYIIISYSYAQSWTGPLFYVWTANIILNILWSPVFFHFNNSSLSLIIIGLMIATLVYILYHYYTTDSTLLFWLNIIYLAWLSFAFYLNLYIVVSN